MNKAIVIPAAILGSVLVLGGTAYGAATYATHQDQKAVATAPAPAHKAQPPKIIVKPKIVVTAPPAPQAQASQAAPQAPIQSGAYGPYLNALAAAGIVAPDNWAIQAANNLEAAWANGQTEAQTNQEYLIPGGIYPYHLATFNSIVHAYFG